jgi:hypothetical protein
MDVIQLVEKFLGRVGIGHAVFKLERAEPSLNRVRGNDLSGGISAFLYGAAAAAGVEFWGSVFFIMNLCLPALYGLAFSYLTNSTSASFQVPSNKPALGV